MRRIVYTQTDKFLPTIRLGKNLCASLGSRRGNSGNHLELSVLTLIHNVP
ncbi:uncharacterized protein LOC106661977 [Cimex lectularius]|uniref:Uncharacterized protein n=1 Tax=Cimex lectularius TaxID=79782 RepID=A0A8I6SI29_CIMLE|nr:uncharacterized protein LOC106661977 [Cimex lectularius]